MSFGVLLEKSLIVLIFIKLLSNPNTSYKFNGYD